MHRVGRTSWAGPCAAAAAAAAFLLAAVEAGAQLPQKSQGRLSPILEELAKPSTQSQPEASQASILGVAESGPGSLVRDGERVMVSVRFDHGAIASRDEVKTAGGRVLNASRRQQTATVSVTPADLRSLAAVGTVAAVTPVRAPMQYAADCEGGSVISEGVQQLSADTARAEFGLDGEGVTVGVLSDSYNQASQAADGSGQIATKADQDIETADLPGAENECDGQKTPVDVLQDYASSEAVDEGRAMMQIVHDVAPNAALSFATAFESEESFAENIEALADEGAEVIVDDVVYFEEPFFQEGPVATAVSTVTEEGATYLSAAGNDNLFDSSGNEIASWEAPEFRDSGGCPSEVESLSGFNGTHCIDFDPGSSTDRTFGIKVEAGETLTIDLQWAEPWNGVGTDIDAFLLDANGGLLGGSVDDNTGTQRPVEIVQWTNNSASEKTVQLVVNRYSGTDPRLKFVLLQNGGGVSGTEYPRSGGGDVVGPTVFGHAGSASAIAVGAVPYDDSSAPEEYSSRGPVTHYFGPVEGTAAAAELAEPEVVSKPDVVATDCGKTTFFAHRYDGEADWRFCGTSAAAPHAAGVVALMAEAEPAAEATDLRSALLGTGASVGTYGACAVGGGLIDAVAGIEAVRGEATAQAPESCSPPDSSEEVTPEPGFEGSESAQGTSQAPSATISPGTTRQATTSAKPTTSIRKHPAKVVRIRKDSVRLSFRFSSNQSDVTFLCSVDGSVYRNCGSAFSRRFGLGAHVLRVKARNSDGQVDSSPATYRFRVKRVR